MPFSVDTATKGLLLSALISGGAALPSPSPSTAALSTADNAGTIFWISKVTPTVFGQDATEFDYYLTSHPAAAQEAINTYAQAAAASPSDEGHLITAFLNATMAGTVTSQQASDNTWKCQELGSAMASTLASCHGVAHPSAGVAERDLSERSLYRWLQSTAHKSSAFAMNTLAGVLGNAIYSNLPQSPRSFCNSADGTNACFSWSRVEATFNEGYARGFVEDALSAVDFNKYSAQADKVLTKRATAADVCLSNRPKGCT